MRARLRNEEGEHAFRERRLEPLENRGGLARGAESAQCLEGFEGEDHFWFVVRIAVVALGRVQREARGVLRCEAFARMLSRGVHLE